MNKEKFNENLDAIVAELKAAYASNQAAYDRYDTARVLGKSTASLEDPIGVTWDAFKDTWKRSQERINNFISPDHYDSDTF